MFNPFIVVAEWIDDFLAGQSAPALCQWRGALMPSESLIRYGDLADNLSPLLTDSHVIPEQKMQGHQFYEPYTVEMSDGTLVSFILVRGTRTNQGELDIAERAAAIASRMAKALTGTLHSFGIYYLSDPMSAGAVYDVKMQPMLDTAARLGGDGMILKNDQRQRIIEGAVEEAILLTVRTHPQGLRPDEREIASQEYRKIVERITKTKKGLKRAPLALFTPFGQILVSRSSGLLKKHESQVMTMIGDLKSKRINIGTTLLSIREACDRVRRMADRELLPNERYPTLLGQPGALSQPALEKGILAPLALGMHILSRKVTGLIDGYEVSRIGNVWYGNSVMVKGCISPRENPRTTVFAAFITKARTVGIPVMVGLEILPKGLRFNRMNQFFNAVLGGLGANNRQIRGSYKELKEYEEAHGSQDPVIGMRINFTTWAKDQRSCEKALLELVDAAEAWGSMDVSAELGAPDHVKVASIPEYTSTSKAPVVPAPLADALYISPLTRPSSPWDFGQLIFKTSDGVLYPVEFGSKLQKSFVTGVVAPSGSGKSFTMNRVHTCLALAAGLSTLPMITIIDVAPSAMGTLRTLRSILPKSLHSQMTFFKVINDPKNCVNMFDTQLGCGPTQIETDFQKAVLEIVFQSLGDHRREMISDLIQAAYRYFAAGQTTARQWQESNHKGVTEALKELGFVVDYDTKVFEVKDALFKAAGEQLTKRDHFIELARIAQRYEVPTLADLGTILMTPDFRQKWQSAKTDSNEPVVEAANRALLSAGAQYPVLAGVTKISLDNARIAVIDLQNVVSSTSVSGNQFAGMMYLYARHLGARNFFLDVDEMDLVARPEYRAYQKRRVKDIQATTKVLSYDEWHYVRAFPGFVALNVAEGRTTRKNRVYLNFITQYSTDFPEEILDGMTSLLVMGSQTRHQNKVLKERLGLSDTDFEILTTDLDRVGKFWAWFKLNDGDVTALLQNDVGPFEAWCYTTNDKDAPIRNGLEDVIGERDALTFLARVFPGGTAASMIDQYSRQARRAQGEGAFDEDEQAKTVTAQIVRDLVKRFEEEQSQAA
jgi:intracellular multiplication protein IcmB